MGKKRHPNFHAVQFVTDISSSFFKSRRGSYKELIPMNDAIRNEIVKFAGRIEDIVDAHVDKITVSDETREILDQVKMSTNVSERDKS